MNTPAKADMWAWWRAALAGNVGPIHADEPQAGFYETRHKHRATQEITRGIVAYWYDAAGKLSCKASFGESARMVDDLRARERWPYASKRPITRETYDAVRSGKGWPDESEAATADRARVAATSDGAPRSNSEAAPVDPDSVEAITERVADLVREAETLIKAGAARTKEASDRAADLAERLLRLEQKADAKRREQMRPHEDAAKTVDVVWRKPRDTAADYKARLKTVVVTPFLKTVAAKVAAETAAAVAAGAPPPPKPARSPTAAGTTSRVSLRTVTSAVIEDWSKAIAYYSENAKVRELIQQLANADARQGTTPPGCKIHAEQAAA